MPTMYDDAEIKCPFFISSDINRVSCEGLDDYCVLDIRFKAKDKWSLYRQQYCKSRFEKCEIYKMINTKYK